MPEPPKVEQEYADIYRKLDVQHHDTIERHVIERIWGVPNVPPPGGSEEASYGVSPIPARSDHTHGPTGGGGDGIPYQEFVHAGELTPTISPEDWWDNVDLELYIVRAWLKTAAGAFSLKILKDEILIQTVNMPASQKAVEVTLATPVEYRGWASQSATGNKASIEIAGLTVPSGRFDLTIHLLYKKPAVAP